MINDRKHIIHELEPFGTCGLEEFEIPLAEAIEKLQAAMKEIPEEYRKSAMFVVWGSGGGDYVSVYPEVRYTEPETDQAMAARHERRRRDAESRAEREEAAERELYKSLKQKYG